MVMQMAMLRAIKQRHTLFAYKEIYSFTLNPYEGRKKKEKCEGIQFD